MLAEHPEVLRRLRQEILEKVGSQRRPTYDDFRDMKFLKAVINGALILDFLVAVSLFWNRNFEVVSCCVCSSPLAVVPFY